MDLVGIENEAEFFPAGALSDGLQDELKEISARWSADLDAGANPFERLKRAAAPYLAALGRLRGLKDAERRREAQRDAAADLVRALGYLWKPEARPTACPGETLAPLLGRVADAEGRDALWLLEAPVFDQGEESADPLGARFQPEQFSEEDRPEGECGLTLAELLGAGIFSLREGPRFALVVAAGQLALIDRNRWPARSTLRFDLQEIFSRKEPDTLLAMACLISREARVPTTGAPLAERLEEEAQRNANAVTASLKATVRDAIEILGQEVLDVGGGKGVDGAKLSLECLRYMYRLLFLFYAEANPRLGVLDLRDELYATGYSLEALRELESVRLRSPQEREGTYLWESLQLTLSGLYRGGGPLRLPRVRISLLDPDSTPILNGLKLRNLAIQKVVRLLSLKQGRSGASRISYAKLGIGQLGAVYETLISFTGIIAREDLIELRPRTGRSGDKAEAQDSAEAEADEEAQDEEQQEAEPDSGEARAEARPEARKDKIDLLAPSYFVPRSRAAEFKQTEIVFDGPEARVYRKGCFIYRLAGRDREKSASYYTPEPLARLLVRHALLERCRDLSADDLLKLKILEPAMGSAAFLVETTNQLADLYLERKQKERGETIPQEEILMARQRVRAYISDRNCFGVDLNPVAVELGTISLWLNSLHKGELSPWFGDQLHAGDSLIGARRAAYDPRLLKGKSKGDLWLDLPPAELGWRAQRPKGHVWQFLLPAEAMAAFDADKSIGDFAAEAQRRIKDWRAGAREKDLRDVVGKNGKVAQKKFSFFAALEDHEIRRLQHLSEVVDQLFEEVAESLARSRAATNDAISIWPDRHMEGASGEDFHVKQRRLDRLTGADHAADTLPYKRLKTAMDAWCALWLWPLDKAHLLPSRAEFLHAMGLLLEGGISADGSLAAPTQESHADLAKGFFHLLGEAAPSAGGAAGASRPLFRETNVEMLIELSPWLGVAAEVAEEARFVHLDLIFADILKERGGFDLIVGNPPWAKPSWNEADVIGDIDPGFVTRKLSAAETKQAREAALSRPEDRAEFLKRYAFAKGAMTATGSAAMNPFAGGGQNNLYRCFIDLAFRNLAPEGAAALIHQDGHLTDPKAGAFRRAWYARIVKHFEFSNKIKTKMFAEVKDERRYSLNLYQGRPAEIGFEQFTNAFLPSQIEDSYKDPDGLGSLPMIKTDAGKWDVRGHRDRIIKIDRAALEAIHALTEDESVPVEEARFLQPYSAKMLEVFRAMAAAPSLSAAVAPVLRAFDAPEGRREEWVQAWRMESLWHESEAQKEGVIRRDTQFQQDSAAMAISGPMFHVGNPLYKTPKAICRTSADYEALDLALIPQDYLPRTNYAPDLEMADYLRRLPPCRWDSTKSHLAFHRVAFRRRIDLNGERSLIPALIAPGIGHINTVESLAFRESADLLTALALFSSIPHDFLIKSLGQGDFRESNARIMPFPDPGATAKHRALRLACLTRPYADLWNAEAPRLRPLPWSSPDPRLALEGHVGGPEVWDRSAALRSDFARRMALVEIDVLAAQALGLTLEQLIDLYRIYFPVLRQNEAATWYDRKGRIVWTASKGLPGVGWLDAQGKSPGRKAWEAKLAENPAELRCMARIDFLPGGPQTVERVFEGPFDRCDRIADYQRAWAFFAARREEEPA